jgi:hypothetical protein
MRNMMGKINKKLVKAGALFSQESWIREGKNNAKSIWVEDLHQDCAREKGWKIFTKDVGRN